MTWHFDADIVALLAGVILLLHNYKTHRDEKNVLCNRKFTGCIHIGIVLAVMDILCEIVERFVHFARINHFCMSLFYLLILLAVTSWFDYALSVLFQDNDRFRKRVIKVTYVISTLFGLLIIADPFTGWFLTCMVGGKTLHGPFHFVIFLIVAIFSLALCAVTSVSRAKNKVDYPTGVFYIIALITATFVALQFYVPGLKMLSAGYMLNVLLITSLIQNSRSRDDRALAERYAELIKYVPCGICLYRYDGKALIPVITNPQYSEMLGEDSMEYLRGVKNMDYSHVHPDDLERLKSESSKALNETGEIDITYRSLNFKTQKYIWTRMRGYGTKYSDGLVLVYVSYYDVTQEYMAEQELWAKYKLMKERTTLEDQNFLVHALINLSTSQTVEYQFADGSEVPIPNRDAFPFIERNAEHIYIDAEEKMKCMEVNNRENLLQRYANGESEIRIEYRRLMVTGKIEWTRCILRMAREPLTSDIMLFQYWYDIEEDKMKDLLYKSLTSENYEYVGRVNLKDKHFVIFPKNGVTYRIPPLQGDDADAASLPLFENGVMEEDREMAILNTRVVQVRKNLSKQQKFTMTYREVTPTNLVSFKKVTMYYLDVEREIVVILREDVTEIIHNETERNATLAAALEAAKKAGMAKSNFLSRVSHELRTPLNAIIGFLELAKDSEEEQLRNYLANSDVAAKQLLAIINDVLDMSSIESGKLSIAHAPFDFKHMLMSVTDIFLVQCEKKGVIFETNILTPVDEWLVGDQLRVNQILMNLLGNAVKFTDSGYVHLNISQTDLKNNEVFIRFEISDTGCGMSEEVKTRLFKPFEQEDALTAQKYGGSGLGLSIVGNLVDMMSGGIHVESKKDEGSTFIVEIPFIKSEIAREEYIPERVRELRVLSVDDEENERKYVSIVLSRIGVRHTCVADGDEAIEELVKADKANDSYNVCIVDWRMPKMSGIDVTKRIRSKYGKHVIVIIVSAYESYQAEENAKIAGANMFISKPLFQSTLFDMFMTLTGGEIASKREALNKYTFDNRRVLVAEDNAMNRMVVEGILKKNNVSFDSVEDGEKCVERFLDSTVGYYDAIFMDIQMPLMDGYHATEAIRTSNHPMAKKIQIIALTANAFSEDIAKSLSSGMNAHVAKPIEPDELLKALEKCITIADM